MGKVHITQIITLTDSPSSALQLKAVYQSYTKTNEILSVILLIFIVRN